jgi:hypothetical protein
MALTKIRASFLVFCILLSGCERTPASEVQARKAASTCGLQVESVESTSGIDYIGTAIFLKEVPKAEFNRKIRCMSAIFMFNRIYGDVSNGSKAPFNYVYID